MGQKVNPHGFRVGVIKGWESQWYADKKDFAKLLVQDDTIRKFLKKSYFDAGISTIKIERAADNLTIDMYCGKPGIAIGKGGAGVEIIKGQVQKLAPGKNVTINIREVKRTDIDAQLVAESIAAQLEKRITFRRAMKPALSRAMKAGAKGIKIMVSGRLNGAEIASEASYHEGSIPLQTLRADIDYGFSQANTTYGAVGVKCWIYKGEVFKAQSEGGNN